jgi:hypothetical protein
MWISNVEPSSWRSSHADAPATARARRGGGAGRVSPRARRRLVASLRNLANRTPRRNATRHRFEVVLNDRLPGVRTDLLEIAALLEHAPEPEPRCVAELHRLLTDGCESPLYNPDVHVSELRAAVYYIRSGLAAGY